jgi:hypothetical protein
LEKLRLIAFLLFSLVCWYVNSQTTITPIFGVEYFNLKDKYIPPGDHYTNFYSSPDETRTYHFGISASKKVLKNYSLKFTVNYSRTEEALRVRTSSQTTIGIKYKTIKNSLQLSREFFEILDVSAGLGLNMLFDIENHLPLSPLDGKSVNSRIFDPGLTLGLGLSKWGIICDFHFFQGIFSRKIWYFKVRQMQVWRFSLGYEFKF